MWHLALERSLCGVAQKVSMAAGIACSSRSLVCAGFLYGHQLQRYVYYVGEPIIVEMAAGYVHGVPLCDSGCVASQNALTVVLWHVYSHQGLVVRFPF